MFGIEVPHHLEIGNPKHIIIRNLIREKAFIEEVKKTVARTCPRCDAPLLVRYASEDEQFIEWECTALCRCCNSTTCEYTDMTDLNGDALSYCPNETLALF